MMEKQYTVPMWAGMHLRRLFNKIVNFLDKKPIHLGEKNFFFKMYSHTSYSGCIYLWVGLWPHDWLVTVVTDWSTYWAHCTDGNPYYLKLNTQHCVYGVHAYVWNSKAILSAEDKAAIRRERS